MSRRIAETAKARATSLTKSHVPPGLRSALEMPWSIRSRSCYMIPGGLPAHNCVVPGTEEVEQPEQVVGHLRQHSQGQQHRPQATSAHRQHPLHEAHREQPDRPSKVDTRITGN